MAKFGAVRISTTAFLTLTNETLDAPEFVACGGNSFVLRGWDVWTTRSIFNTRACYYTNNPVRYGGLDCKKLSMLFKSVVLV